MPVQILLMGSAAKLTGPKVKTLFLEDLPPEEAAKVAAEPSGLSKFLACCFVLYMDSIVFHSPHACIMLVLTCLLFPFPMPALARRQSRQYVLFEFRRPMSPSYPTAAQVPRELPQSHVERGRRTRPTPSSYRRCAGCSPTLTGPPIQSNRPTSSCRPRWRSPSLAARDLRDSPCSRMRKSSSPVCLPLPARSSGGMMP